MTVTTQSSPDQSPHQVVIDDPIDLAMERIDGQTETDLAFLGRVAASHEPIPERSSPSVPENHEHTPDEADMLADAAAARGAWKNWHQDV
jgi:hypothetical protein